ncbi:MAG: DUF885 family protein [Verrucomicrobia bacterium]|nr:DUF885 family protein [Verrucomicrobiota bacterium]
MGQLKMKELRVYIQKGLGEQFDTRAFYDELLGNGALPMDILEARMKAWVAGKGRTGSR